MLDVLSLLPLCAREFLAAAQSMLAMDACNSWVCMRQGLPCCQALPGNRAGGKEQRIMLRCCHDPYLIASISHSMLSFNPVMRWNLYFILHVSLSFAKETSDSKFTKCSLTHMKKFVAAIPGIAAAIAWKLSHVPICIRYSI